MAKIIRATKQRSAIIDAFEKEGRPLSPKEVIAVASREVPNLGIATVYRNIKSMQEEGVLEAVDIPGQSPRYCRPGKRSPVLFICDESERVFFLPEDSVSLEFTSIPKGFTPLQTLVILNGVVA